MIRIPDHPPQLALKTDECSEKFLTQEQKQIIDEVYHDLHLNQYTSKLICFKTHAEIHNVLHSFTHCP